MVEKAAHVQLISSVGPIRNVFFSSFVVMCLYDVFRILIC